MGHPLKKTPLSSADLTLHWRETPDFIHESIQDEFIKEMAICFLHLCQGAALGSFSSKGRVGAQLQFTMHALTPFVETFSQVGSSPAPLEDLDGDMPGSNPKNASSSLDRSLSRMDAEEMVSKTALRPKVYFLYNSEPAVLEKVTAVTTLGNMLLHTALPSKTNHLVADENFNALRTCTHAVICIPGNPKYLSDEILSELSAAYMHCDKRVFLIHEDGAPLSEIAAGITSCSYSNHSMSDITDKLTTFFNSFRE